MLASIACWEIAVFLAVLGVLVAWKLLTGGITTRGLLSTGRDGVHSPARVQLLLSTIGGAFWYLGLVASNPDPARLPDVPNTLLLGMGLSHIGYLAAKGADRLGWLRSLLGKN